MSKKKAKTQRPASVKKTTRAEAKKPEAVEPKKAKTTKVETPKVDLEALKKPVEEARIRLDNARDEARGLMNKARGLIREANETYHQALTPYRDACRKAGVTCEYEGGRRTNVSEKVSFLVEKTDKGVRVMVKGRPETDEVIPMETLNKSITKASYAYAEKFIGPREKVGNKGGSLSNRLRAVLNA